MIHLKSFYNFNTQILDIVKPRDVGDPTSKGSVWSGWLSEDRLTTRPFCSRFPCRRCDTLGRLSLGLSEGIILLLDVDILNFLSKLDNIKYHLNYYISRQNNW